jgi:hypothetical protein
MTIAINKVWFDKDFIFVQLKDERIVGTPIRGYPNLAKSTDKQRNVFELKGDCRWIHWPELDEDLDAEGFLNYVMV